MKSPSRTHPSTTRGPKTPGTAVAAIVLAAAASAPSAAARAQEGAPPATTITSPTPSRRHGLDASLSLVASTLGLGAEVNKLVTSHLSLRVGANFLSYGLEQAQEDVNYEATIEFRNFSALVDLYPFRRGSFHLSGGMVSGSNDVTGVGIPADGGTYTINGTDYTSDQVASIHAQATFPSARPYAGLGWGSPAKHGFHLTTDFGAVFGTPKYTMTTIGAGAPELSADLEAERHKVQANIDRYAKVYPVFRTGLTYAF